MSTKTFNLVKTCIAGAQVIAVAIVTYCVKDATVAASVNAAIIIACTATVEICSKFVKN